MAALTATPPDLIQALTFENRPFQSLAELTGYIHDVTRQNKVPYSATRTSTVRPIQLFNCRFGGRQFSNSSAKTGCPSYIRYKRLDDGTYSLLDCDFTHNHSLDRTLVEAHTNCCSPETMIELKRQQELQIPPGQIRANLDITCPPSTFYNMRKDVIKREKIETFETFLDSSKGSEFKSIVAKDSQGTLQRFTVLNSPISVNSYASDVMITDDTASTNYYNMRLQIIVVIDSEGKSQILSFGGLSGGTNDAFKEFFQDVYEMSGLSPRVVVLDRALPQYNAVKKVFPSATLVFCLRHLGRDLEKYFNINSDIIRGFYDIQINLVRGYSYLQLLETTRNGMSKTQKGHKILTWMLENFDNWLPIRLVEQGILFE